MVTGNATPTPREAEIIASLVGGASKAATARTLGISIRTVSRCAEKFEERIANDRSERATVISDQLRDRAIKAVRRLDELMDAGNEGVALGAVRTALAESLRWAEQVELADRVASIERRMGLTSVPMDQPYVR